MQLSLEERETHISQSADDRSIWNVFSDDLVFHQRMERLNIAPHKEIGEGRWYRLNRSQVRIVKAQKPLTDAQKAERVQRLKKPLQPGRKSA